MSTIGQTIQSSEDMKKMKYAEALLKEVTRFYGPLPLNFARLV